ncbi:MAG: HAD-IIB family hydrolase [Clostridia bacterium]|nr:HAD-IIB family hydrolase [Clostridia bacterium]
MNKIKDKYAIFLDIDGTLMGSSSAALDENLAVIQKVRALGHKVLISTGRSTAYLPSNIDIEKYFDGVVSGAGARVVIDGKEVFCKTMTRENIKAFCEYSIENGIIGVLEGIDNMFFMGIVEEGMGKWIHIDSKNISEYLTKALPIEKFTILGIAPEELNEILTDCVILQHDGYAEILQKDCSKSSGMKIAAAELGVDSEHCIAMGDSLNDFDMIENAGIGVAMGNAVPEIKEIADMITKDVDNAGVAVALKEIFSLKD